MMRLFQCALLMMLLTEPVWAGMKVPIVAPSPTSAVKSPKAEFPYSVEVSEDAFEKSKTVSLSGQIIEELLRLNDHQFSIESTMELSLKKVSNRHGGLLLITVIYEGKDWVFIEAGPALSFLNEKSKKISFSSPQGSLMHRDTLDDGRVQEIASFIVSVPKLKTLLASKSLKMRVSGQSTNWDAEVPEGVRANFERFYKEQLK